MNRPFGSPMRHPQMGPMFVGPISGGGIPMGLQRGGMAAINSLRLQQAGAPLVMSGNSPQKRVPPQQRISRPGLKQVDLSPAAGTATISTPAALSTLKTKAVKRQSTDGLQTTAPKVMKTEIKVGQTTAFYLQINLTQVQIILCQIQINLCQIQINLCQIQINLCQIQINLCQIQINLCQICSVA